MPASQTSAPPPPPAAKATPQPAPAKSFIISGSDINAPTFSGDTRTIAALVTFASAFALVGVEVKASKGVHHANPATVIIGGGVAAVILTLISHAGDAGRSMAMGLAIVTFASSLVINGGPVASAVTNLTGGGSRPSAVAASSAASQPSTPTTPKKLI
jgi:hypothetical protein